MNKDKSRVVLTAGDAFKIAGVLFSSMFTCGLKKLVVPKMSCVDEPAPLVKGGVRGARF